MSNVPHSPPCMCQACQDEALAIEIRKDAETLRAVTAERDTLLRDCWEACGGKGPDSSDDELVGTISTMRVGLERWQKRVRNAEAERDALQAENAQLRDVLADRDMDREMAARSKLELIEANRQLEALRARIEDAPCATVFLGACNDLAITTAELNDDIVGKCVRLVIEND